MANLANFAQNYLFFILLAIAIFLLVFLVWNIAFQIQLTRLKKKNKALFTGNKIKNLEDVLLEQAKNLKLLDKDIQELYSISNQINHLAARGFHKSGMVRFNPFKDVGGDQSFSLALLDGKNDGLTISSLFTREGSRVYSKSIIGGKTEKYPLTEEEKEAIEIAMRLEIKK